MRISDWSSDVCSSDLVELFHAKAIFSGHAVGIEEIEKYAARKFVAAGAEDDGDVRGLHAVDGAPDVVDIRPHEIHMIIAIGRTREDSAAVGEAVREGTQESGLSRDIYRDKANQLAE